MFEDALEKDCAANAPAGLELGVEREDLRRELERFDRVVLGGPLRPGYLVSSAPAELLVRRDTHRRVKLVQQRLVLVDPLVFLLLLLPLNLGRVGNWGHSSALDAVLLDEVSARGRIV